MLRSICVALTLLMLALPLSAYASQDEDASPWLVNPGGGVCNYKIVLFAMAGSEERYHSEVTSITEHWAIATASSGLDQTLRYFAAIWIGTSPPDPGDDVIPMEIAPLAKHFSSGDMHVWVYTTEPAELTITWAQGEMFRLPRATTWVHLDPSKSTGSGGGNNGGRSPNAPINVDVQLPTVITVPAQDGKSASGEKTAKNEEPEYTPAGSLTVSL